MIPDPDLVSAGLERLLDEMNQIGWDKPPLVAVIRGSLSDPEHQALFGNDRTALAIEPGFTPNYFSDTMRDLIIMASALCYPDRVPTRLHTHPINLKYFDDDFAGLIFGIEVISAEDIPDDYEGSLADLPGAYEMRILAAVDTTGTSYVVSHRRDTNERCNGRLDFQGNKVGDHDLHDFCGPTLNCLFTAMLGICHHHLSSTAHELPALPPAPDFHDEFIAATMRDLDAQEEKLARHAEQL